MDVPMLLREFRQTTKFKPDDIDDVIIGKILDAADQAPSAGKLDPWKFIVIRDGGTKTKLAEASLHMPFVRDAPVVIVVCGDIERAHGKYAARGERLYVIQDTAYASLLIMLACKSLDIGCYFVRAFDEEKVRELLDIPESIRPFTIIPIGHPLVQQEKEDKISFEHVTYLEKYGKKQQGEARTAYEIFTDLMKRKNKQ